MPNNLTGLMVAGRKNVSAINAEFAQTTDPSCLNRRITQVPWDAEQLNEHRLAWLQGHSWTRYWARGVIAIDNTLVDPSEEMIEDVGWFWDHADRGYPMANDHEIAHYACVRRENIIHWSFAAFASGKRGPRTIRPCPSRITRTWSG